MGMVKKFSTQDYHPLWEEAFNQFELTPTVVEPLFKCFTGVHYLNGAFINKHTDPAPPDFVHVRCNVLLKKPSLGGLPIISNKIIEVNQWDMWICLASLEEHSSTPLIKGERVVFSFGGLVQMSQIKGVFNGR
jgi:hypothetical protein